MRNEDDESGARPQDALRMTTDIVASFLRNNKSTPEELTDLIRSVHRTIAGLSGQAIDKPEERPKPAVPIG
jgi:predicted transcriptional regulator